MNDLATFYCTKFLHKGKDEAEHRRPSPKRPSAARGGLSVRSQLDPKVGGARGRGGGSGSGGGGGGQDRKELLARDPLFFVKVRMRVRRLLCLLCYLPLSCL